MKLLTIVFFFVCGVTSAQMYKRGDIIMSAGKGFPNKYSFTSNGFFFRYTDGNGKYETVFLDATENPPSWFVRFELLSDKRVSNGLELSYVYNLVSDEFTTYHTETIIDTTTWDGLLYPTEVSIPTTHHITCRNEKIGLIYNMTFHFSRNRKRFDGYITYGFGLNYKRTTGLDDGLVKNYTPLGLAFRAGLGMNYFFTKNIGINLACRLGGPAISGGISVKF